MTDWQRIRADVVHLFHYDDYFNEQTSSCLQSIKSFDSLNIWRVALGIKFVRWGLLGWQGGGVGLFWGSWLWGEPQAAHHRRPCFSWHQGLRCGKDFCRQDGIQLRAVVCSFTFFQNSSLQCLACRGFLSSEPHSLNNLEQMTTFLASCFLICEMRIPPTPSSLSSGITLSEKHFHLHRERWYIATQNYIWFCATHKFNLLVPASPRNNPSVSRRVQAVTPERENFKFQS